MKEKNPYGLSEEEVERLEARADFLDELAEIRNRNVASNCTEGYTWERVKQPKERIIHHDTEF